MFSAITFTRDALRGAVAYSTPELPGATRLHANELRTPLPAHLRADLDAHLAKVIPNDYPDPSLRGLKSAASAALGVPADNLTFGNGSDELLQLLALAFNRPVPPLADGRPQGGVLIPTPTFSVYRVAADIAQMRTVEVPLRADFSFDEAAFWAAVEAERPQLVFLATPNNPTGRTVPRPFIEQLLARRDSLIVVDEAYGWYSGTTMRDAVASHPNLIVLNTLSKVGFAGARLGFVAASTEIAGLIDALRMPYNIPAWSAATGEWVFRHLEDIRPVFAAVVAERDRLMAALAAIPGVTVFPTEGNLFLIRVPDAPKLCEALKARRILVRNFHRPGLLSHCIRVSVGEPHENDALIAGTRELLAANG